jgi:hypothetical protein
MSKSDHKAEKPQTLRRFISPIQSQGELGKSTLVEAILSALKFWKVPFAALDADAQHRTLSMRNKDVIARAAATNKNEFHSMIQALPDVPVTLVDFPSGRTDELLQWFQEFHVIDGFEREGIRPTFLFFLSDKAKAKESASKATQIFDARADYILVENPAKFESDDFKSKPLYRLLLDMGSPTISMPALTPTALNSWDALERSTKQRYSLDNVCDPSFGGLHWTTQGTLQHFRNVILSQLEDIAVPRIVPDAGLIQNRVTRLKPFKTVATAESGLHDALL